MFTAIFDHCIITISSLFTSGIDEINFIPIVIVFLIIMCWRIDTMVSEVLYCSRTE